MTRAYYNEIDPVAAHVLRALIADGVIAAGDVDERSIVDVQPDDLKGYDQCHFFAGGGLWSVAARMAGLPDDAPIWTGSCPCQPLSVAGLGKGSDDERHLWPAFFRLITKRAPPIVFGEQVASRLGREWFAGVRADLEGVGYACGAADLCAAGVGAPHIRQRIYWVADADSKSIRGRLPREIAGAARANEGEAQEWEWFRADASSDGQHSGMGYADGSMLKTRAGDGLGVGETGISGRSFAYSGDAGSQLGDSNCPRPQGHRESIKQHDTQKWQTANGCIAAPGVGFWDDAEWVEGGDGKARRSKPGIRLLVDGLPGRVGLLRLGGNAIVPQVAATFIKAIMRADAI